MEESDRNGLTSFVIESPSLTLDTDVIMNSLLVVRTPSHTHSHKPVYPPFGTFFFYKKKENNIRDFRKLPMI